MAENGESSLRDRSPKQVFEDHLRLRRQSEFDEDLERNYDPAVVVMTARQVFRGHDGVRKSAHLLWRAIPDAGAYVYDSVLVDDRFALLEWRARTDEINVTCGVDSYLIEDGWIRGQTIHYRVENLELSVAGSILAGPAEPGPASEDDENRLDHMADATGGGQ